jgi:hypothetical protein
MEANDRLAGYRFPHENDLAGLENEKTARSISLPEKNATVSVRKWLGPQFQSLNQFAICRKNVLLHRDSSFSAVRQSSRTDHDWLMTGKMLSSAQLFGL